MIKVVMMVVTHLLTVETMSQHSKAEAPKASAARLLSSLMLLN